MDRLIERILQAIDTIKTPVILIIFTIALIQVGYAVFIGKGDKRDIVTTVVGLIGLALMIIFARDLVDWIARR
jgi:hypothetical protein